MRIKWLTKKAATEPDWPDVINGYLTRPRCGDCPGCGAADTSWCDSGCTRLDPMDYR